RRTSCRGRSALVSWLSTIAQLSTVCSACARSRRRDTSMPELFETMQTMRAMRRLKPDPVPDELIKKILEAGVCAANGANPRTWRFLVVKDSAIKRAVQVHYKRAFDEVMGPQYRTVAPPPNVSKEAYQRQLAAVEYLTDHFHEAPVWIVGCIDHGKGTP